MARSLRARSSTPTLVQKNGHSYQGERTIKSDLSSMQGPIYNSGKATKLNFGGGYVAPKATTNQQELVNKFFKQDKSETVQSETKMSVQMKTESRMESKMESKIEFSSGEERRKEALERRQEFLKENEDLHMKIKSSDFKMTNVKTRQQLEEERESFFKNTVKRVQEEATMISNRAKEDEQKRVEFLKREEERIMREEKLRQEAMLRAEEERKQKELARQEMLKKQQMEFANQRAEMERQNLMKRQQEEEER
jgi:chromosome segregation protein